MRAAGTSRRKGPRHERLARAAVVGLVVYLVLVALPQAVGPSDGHEIFPFSAFSLFSKVPAAESSGHGVRFTSIDGAELEEPTYYEDLQGRLGPVPRASANDVISDLGEALDRGDADAAEESRRLLESRFMPSIESARYEVVRTRWDLRQRYECRCFVEETVLGTFELER
jgi:hypothetical protein